MKEEIEEFIWNGLIWAIVLIMLGSYVMDYGTVFNGTIVLVVLWFLYTFAQYFYRTDIKKEMEETILILLIWAIVLTFLYYCTGYGLFFNGTIILWGVLLSTFGWYFYRTVIKTPAEIRKLQKKIRDYKPSQWTAKDTGEGFQRPSKIRLGVFGVQNSGKSSFLNSLHFAFKGNWEEVHVEKGNALDGGETMFRDPIKLSDKVTTLDTRGLVDLSVSRVPEVIAQITGKRGLNTRSHAPGEKIDCPIFILKCRSWYTETQDRTEFLTTLVPEVRKHLCGYPIMVVTFANRISNQEEILRAITMAGMAKGSVFFIENYTAVNHEMDSEKHIALLKILEACIKRADENITFRWLAENETSENESIFERMFVYNRVTKEAKKNDCDNLPEKAQSDGTDRAESIDHAIGIDESFTGRDTRSSSTVVISIEESRDQDFDSTLKTIAKRIHNDVDIDSLGGELGFEPPEIQRYIQSNKQHQNITYMGTLNMLRNWRSRTKKSEECEKLRRALNASNHLRLADELL